MVNLAAAKNGNGGSVPLQNIYILLNQAKKHGFVEELKAFKPSAREIEEDAKALQRKYYGITVSGRKALIDARKLVTKI
jgi:DNA-binding PadR family transcriptional regulator